MHFARTVLISSLVYGSLFSFAFAQSLLGDRCVVENPQAFGASYASSTDADVRVVDVIDIASPPLEGTARPKPFDTIVFHDPGSPNCDPIAALTYGHTYDSKRGGYFGYHFYIAQNGDMYQAASLARRTNHVKPSGPLRNRHIYRSNSSAIGITLICGHKPIPEAQLKAAVKLAHMLQVAYGISSLRVFGHGELQTDRSASEGLVAARATRTTSPRGDAHISYVQPNGGTSRCQISGNIPPGCSDRVQCEFLDTITRLSAIHGNTGYALPAPGSGITTDAQEAGYGQASQTLQQTSVFFYPNFLNPFENHFTGRTGSVGVTPINAVRQTIPTPQKKSATTTDACRGSTVAQLTARRDASVRSFNAKYKTLGTWSEVLASPPRDAADAVAFAKRIQYVATTLEACKRAGSSKK